MADFINENTGTWRALTAHLKKMEAACLTLLINPGTGSEKTQYVRGQISMLQSIVDLPRREIREELEPEDLPDMKI